MNKLLNILMISLMALAAASCKPEVEVEIGEPGSKLDGINAEWQLVAAQIVDLNTINGDSISITDYYTDGGAPEISFNSSDFSYSVVDAGKKNFFGTSGTWAFDDDEFPTMITMMTSEGVEIELDLTATIRPQDPRLRFNYSRECDENAYAIYYFEYTRK